MEDLFSRGLTEAIASTDLTDVDAKTGTGTTIVFNGNPTLAGFTASSPGLFADGTFDSPSIAFSTQPNSGFHLKTGGGDQHIRLGIGGSAIASLGTSNVAIPIFRGNGDYPLLGVGNQTDAINGNPDVLLWRDGPGIWATRNGANAQEFRVYGLFNSATDYRRLSLSYNAGNVEFIIDSQAQTSSVRPLTFATGGIRAFRLGTTQHLEWITDNINDIGLSAGNRPRSIYWGTQLLGPNGSTSSPSFSFASDTDTGMFWSSVPDIRWTVGAGSQLILNGSQLRFGVNAIWITDNANDIGANGATRPRSIYFGTQILAPDGSSTSPSYTFASSPGDGMWINGSVVMFDGGGTSSIFGVTGAGVQVRSDANIGFSSTTSAAGSGDLFLFRAAAGTIEQRNGGTNAVPVHQINRIYRFFVSSTDYGRLSMGTSGTTGLIETQTGTGAQQMPLVLRTGTNGGNTILGRSGNNEWEINPNLVTTSDNSRDIGTSGSNRPRNIYCGTQFLASSTVSTTNPDYSFASETGLGLYRSSAGRVIIVGGSQRSFFFDTNSAGGLAMKSDALFAWTSSASDAAGTKDTILNRGGAGILELKNADSAQTFRVFGQSVTGTRYGRIAHDGLNFLIDETGGGATIIGKSGGNLGFFGVAGIARQSLADIQNNVTAGGTDDRIETFTSLTVYATDAPVIRDDIYQLARKVKQIVQVLRNYGLAV